MRLMGKIQYDTRAKLPRLPVPVLVMRSRMDDSSVLHQAEGSIAVADEPKCFCELHGSHNDAVGASMAYVETIEKLMYLVESRVGP